MAREWAATPIPRVPCVGPTAGRLPPLDSPILRPAHPPTKHAPALPLLYKQRGEAEPTTLRRAEQTNPRGRISSATSDLKLSVQSGRCNTLLSF
uniref:Uncharacterized protein n=1 Tax=Oryza punctata TaxID=4537 RepID=A0A0E0JHD8_ORYPU